MKKKTIIYIFVCIMLLPLNGQAADEESFGLSDEVIMNNLKRMDITRTEWNLEGYLTRKEALTLAYIAKNIEGRVGGREYSSFAIKDTGQSIDENRKIVKYRQNAKEGVPYYHVDLQTIEDYSLDSSFLYNLLYTGTMREGKYYAEWEREVTYEEALAIVERMSANMWEFMSIEDTYQPKEGFLKRAEDAGFINGSNRFCPSLKVTEEMRDKKIPVKDFMRLLYNGMFMYREDGGYGGDFAHRLISGRAEIRGENGERVNGLNADSFEDIKQFLDAVGLIDEQKEEYKQEISRGVATEIAYRIKTGGEEIFSSPEEAIEELNRIGIAPEYTDIDIETKEGRRAAEYVYVGLLKGREENGEKTLALNESMTNEEGLILMLRMLNNENGNIGGQQLNIDSETDIFTIAEEEKLINVNQDGFGKSVCLTQEELLQPLTYGIYYFMVNDSLYIPRTFDKDKGIYGRYIEQYIEILEIEKEEDVDITL